MSIELVRPAREHLPAYIAALEGGWTPDNLMGLVGTQRELTAIGEDPVAFLAHMDDPQGRGPPVLLPDGSTVPRLPGYRRWIWDGDFCGFISLRWRPGSSTLPPHVAGHIGYGVVPAKAGRGYATRALALLLPDARARGLNAVELTTDPDNIASQRVILANGGVLVERFRKSPALGGAESLRFRIQLSVEPGDS